MKRWVWLLCALGMPLSSPMGCGGDGCLRNSDCPSDQTCRAGQCQLKELPEEAQGGAGSDEPMTSAGSSMVAGNAGSDANGGKGGAAGSAGSAGTAASAGSDADGGEGAGEGGMSGAAGDGAAGDGGAATTTSGGAP